MVQVFTAHIHIARFFAQTRAATRCAWAETLVFGQFLTHGRRIGFAVAAFQIGNNAFKCVAAIEGSAFVIEVAKVYDFFA